MSATIWIDTETEKTLELGGTIQLYKAFQDMANADGPGFETRWPDLFGVPSQSEDSDDCDPDWLSGAAKQASMFLRLHRSKLEPHTRDVLETIRGVLKNRSAPTENVFCPNGPGGGIDPKCSPKTAGQDNINVTGSKPTGGGGQTGTTGAPSVYSDPKRLATEHHRYNVASPKDKMKLLEEHSYPVQPGKLPTVEEFRKHIVGRISQYAAEQKGVGQSGVKTQPFYNPAHEAARQKIVELQPRLDAVDKRVKDLEVKGASAKTKTEQDAITVEKYRVRKEKEQIAAEAHAIIKDALTNGGTNPGQKVDKAQFKDTNEAPNSFINLELVKARQFLDGMVQGQTPPVDVAKDPGGRAHYKNGSNRITLDSMSDASIAAHEYGHHIEHNLPGAARAANAFREARVGNEQGTTLKQKFPDGVYKDSEVGYQDQFSKVHGEGSKEAYYTGKKYDDGSTEVISMGLETMYKQPVKFARDDPEYFNFMMGVLGGEARKP